MSTKAKTTLPRGLPEGYSYDQLRPLVHAALEAGLSVFVRGHPGIGKSALAEDLAGAMQRPLIDVRLAQRDPAEVAGVYFPNRERQALDLLAPDWVRQACDGPAFVLLDEINAAVTKLHQAAAYQIVLEHRVGPFVFHPRTVVMAAGNLEEDRAIVTPLSSALCNRFVHFIMRPEAASWLRWAAAHEMNEQIMAFVLASGEEVLYQPSTDYAFPTPRSWEMASRVMSRVEEPESKRVIAACVGLPMAERFVRFAEMYHKVPAERIIRSGQAIAFTKGRAAEPSFIYAAAYCVAAYVASHELEDPHLPHIVRFLRSPGLDPEYAMLFLRQLQGRAPIVIQRLRQVPEFRALARELVNLKLALYH